GAPRAVRDRYGDSGDSSDSSESSGDDVALDPREEREFYRTLALLKTRDPRIYREDSTFYTRQGGGGGGGGGGEAKPMFLKDYERKVVLEKEGGLWVWGGVSEVWADPDPPPPPAASALSWPDSDDEEEEGEVLLRPRVKSRQEKVRRGGEGSWGRPPPLIPPRDPLPKEPLQKFWSDPALEPGFSDEGEQFLQRQQEFERRHNFRFEEPGAAQIQTFPRQIPTSVRRRDERRKEKREQIRERKRKGGAGGENRPNPRSSGGAAFGLSRSLLQEEFDPASHDRLMAEWFGEDYYGQEEEEKPQFEEEEGLDEEWNWDSWTGREEEPHCEDPDFVVRRGRGETPPLFGGGRRRKTTPVPPPPHSLGPFEQYLDEFYGLDFEDTIGDLPCRFKYRRVLPPKISLFPSQILAADDKELNRWCSCVKPACTGEEGQEERQDQANYSRRAQKPEEETSDPQIPQTREKRKRQEEGKGETPPETPLRPLPKIQGVPDGGGGPPWAAVRLGGREFSGKRLEAFGLNPRRLRFRQLRREQGKEGGGGKKGGETPGKCREKWGGVGKCREGWEKYREHREKLWEHWGKYWEYREKYWECWEKYRE
uniref:Protein KRI1 homolog n=1 Tax=Catharus ustulatus TaxID=91951 RepID=A0A8C3UF84_CATUS